MSRTRPLDRLERTLERLSATLRWPAWDRSAVAQLGRSWLEVAAAVDRAQESHAGGAYVRVFGESAIDAARRRSTERDARPLAGLPIAIKDLVAVAGQPIGAGSAVRESAPPERVDSAIVGQFLGLGAVVVGLVTLHEFAFGVTGVNEHVGYPRNPHDPDRVPGGSSSGPAVAVAEGSAGVAIGTDTGGSVRIPAALCGVVGFKPAYGTYPTTGVFPLAPSLDHVGLIASSVDVVQAVHAALGHIGASDAPLRSIGIVEADLEEADAEVVARVETVLQVLRNSGVEVLSVAWPDAERSFATSTAIMFSEASAIHRDTLERMPDRYGADVRRRLEAGFAIDAPTYVAAKREQRTLRAEVQRTLEAVDAVVTPTVPMVAPTVAGARGTDVPARLVRNTRLANVVGVPAISIPVPGSGLPVGLQITADDEPTLLSVAAQIERLIGAAD